jgi:uncharacterized protein
MLRIFKILLLLSPITLLAQPKQQVNPNGHSIFYYDNGKVASEGTLRNGKPDGYWKTYYENGVLKSEGNRSDFKLDSLWRFYSEKGILVSEHSYTQGEKDGLTKTFDNTNGFLVTTEEYKKNLKNGNTTSYFKPTLANTQGLIIQKIIPFENGLENGTGFEYNEKGEIITVIEYTNGILRYEDPINRTDENGLKQGEWKTFHTNGLVKEEMNYVDDKLDGKIKTYDITGNLIKPAQLTKQNNGGTLQDAAPPKIIKEYYKNGQVKSIGAFQNDKAVGEHKEFSATGEALGVKLYAAGIVIGEGKIDSTGNRNGPWKIYYPTGKLKGEGDYLNNKHIGAWIYYYPSGDIEQKGKYDTDGRAQNTWEWYYAKQGKTYSKVGPIKRTEHYINGKLEGEMIEYNDTGAVVTTGHYLANQKEGLWVLEYLDYKEEGVYNAGKRTGTWKQYYRNTEQLRFEGSFLDNEPDGEHTFYYANGKKRLIGTYVAGLKDGKWKYYDEAGALFLLIIYEKGREVSLDGIEITTKQ